MKFEIDRAVFLKSLTAAVSVMERRNTIPILGNIYISAATGHITVKASDLDIETTDRMPCNVTTPGATTVPGVMLMDIVKKMPDGAMVSFDETETGVTIKAGRSRFQLPTLPAADYPVMATAQYQTQFLMPAADLARLLDKSKFAMSSEETRYYLCGVYLHRHDEKLRAVSTDGHRLACIDVTAPEGSGDVPGVIIPRKTVEKFAAALKGMSGAGNVELSVSETKIRLTHEFTSIVSKVVDGKFPDYTRVIPQNVPNSFSVDAGDFRSALGRVSSVLDGRSNGVKIDVKGDEVDLSARGPDSQASDQIVTGYDGPDLSFGFNGKYMSEVAALISDLMVVNVGDVGSPILIRDSDDVNALFVVMPMRV